MTKTENKEYLGRGHYLECRSSDYGDLKHTKGDGYARRHFMRLDDRYMPLHPRSLCGIFSPLSEHYASTACILPSKHKGAHQAGAMVW